MNVRNIDISDFDYPLPAERIALHPVEPRDSCRLLVRNSDGAISDYHFTELSDLMAGDSLLVCNNTKVINARLHFRKPTGALIEIFCLEPVEPSDYALSFASTSEVSWKCFVGNSKRWRNGSLSRNIETPDGEMVTLTAEREATSDKASVVTFRWDNPNVSFSQIVETIGEIPIPPYLNRESEDADKEDYQTVFSRIEGSVAAPTAGLHFTPRLLDLLKSKGIERRELTLHVGAGTFQPVQTHKLEDHHMHSEFIEVNVDLIRELARTDKNITAVGTTSVRTLESLYHLGVRAIAGEDISFLPQWEPYGSTATMPDKQSALMALADEVERQGNDRLIASTAIIIAPGYEFKVVNSIVTNFHQPCSTLLLLVSAFTGGDWRKMYDHALVSDYRFLSYGDAMLLL